MTGSKPQLYNGIALLVVFFCCRLVWGTYQSAVVYVDMWKAVQRGPDAGYIAAAFEKASGVDKNLMHFAKDAGPVPVWLAVTYVASNLTLNTLNWYWYFKMISAVKKRFEPAKKEKAAVPAGAKGTGNVATGAMVGEKQGLRQRAHSIEDVVPDSEELRQGTIQ